MKWFLLLITILQFTNSWAQHIKLGIIDFYGNRKVTVAQVREKLLFHEGDSIGYEQVSLRKDSSLQLLKTIPGVKNAAFDFICCDDNKGQYMLFVGIDEGGQPPVSYRPAPDSPYVLPDAIMQHYHFFGEALESAVASGATAENHAKGHALSQDSGVRIWQYKFIDDANNNFQLLQKVLYYAEDPEQRAAAAQIIAYASDKKKIVAPLLYGVSDADDDVRNNAARALGVLAVYAQQNPKQGIVIPSDPFIKLINSLIWTDRNKGAMVLLSLTQSRDKKLLDRLRKEALPALIEMAKWKNTGHAYSSMMILGRMAGFKDDDVGRAMAEGNKDDMLYKILDKL
jgi:hypothetical protein